MKQRLDFLFGVSTYTCDIPLFRKLGLKPFKNIPLHKKYYVGKVKVDGALVKIWVEGLPAQFWKFEIQVVKCKKYEMTTGSGSFEDYWSIAKLIAGDMVVVKEMK